MFSTNRPKRLLKNCKIAKNGETSVIRHFRRLESETPIGFVVIELTTSL